MDFLDFDFLEIHPFVKKEFDYSQNKDIKPQELTIKYKSLLWWKCNRDHKWQATLQDRIDGKNCPICTNRGLIRGKTDLAATHPELLAEWDYKQNNTLKPDDVTEGSTTRVHWICSKCGYAWITSVRQRTGPRKSGCPACARKKVWDKRYKKKLNETSCISDPKLLQDWDYEKNEPLKPSDFTPSSHKNVWWKCHVCGYSFKDKIAGRAKALYCPVCTNRVIVKGYNDLATTHPEIAAQWHPTKNGNLKPTDFSHGNGKKIWWICPIGHEYKSTILNRTKIRGNGNNCPICDARRHTSFSEQAVFYYLKKYFPDTINRFSANFLGKFEIDIYIPSLKVAVEYDGKAWHTEKIFERDMRKYAVCKENKIKLIRLKEIKKESDCKTCDIVLYTFWEHETLNKTIIDLLDMLNIQDTNIDVDIERDKFKITKLMDNEYAESFGYKYPNLVKEWHPTKNLPAVPTMFASGTQFKVWWVCPDCGNVYQARIVSRVNGTGCPKCARHRFLYNKCKKVAKLDLKTNEVIEVYDSITDAAKSCGLRSSSNITSVCKGTKTSIGGFGWKYI